MDYTKANSRVEKTLRILEDSKKRKGNANKRGSDRAQKSDSSTKKGWQNILHGKKGGSRGIQEGPASASDGNRAPAMAAALKYEPEQNNAPQISALGKGIIAENIIRAANKANVPVYKDEELVSTLNKLRVGDEIPHELFEVVAEVLVFICRSDARYRDKYVCEGIYEN